MYDPKCGLTIIEWAAECNRIIEQMEGGADMEVNYNTPIDVAELNRLRASQRSKGQFVQVVEKAAKGKQGEITVVAIDPEVDTSFANHVSGYNRAIEKLNMQEKIELIKDKDGSRVILFVK